MRRTLRTAGSLETLPKFTAAQVGALPSTDDLSAIAIANATAANVAMNSKKITGLANGTAASDAAAFGQIPSFASTAGKAWRSAALSLAANVDTKVPLDTKVFDNGPNFDVATNHRYNVPTAGVYLCLFQAGINTATAGIEVTIALYHNGVLYATGLDVKNANTTQAFIYSGGGDIVSCAAADYFELFVSASAATSLAVGTADVNYLSVCRIA